MDLSPETAPESGDTPAAPSPALVKGLTFQTARRFFTNEFGPETFEVLMAGIPAESRALFEDASINDWYPEEHLRSFIHRVYEVVAKGDDERFEAIARDLALAGISRFFRMLINLASPRFALRKVPVVWRRLRRGTAVLETEVTDAGTIIVRYTDFPYCGDRIYRMLSMSNCQALVVAACGKVPVARLLSHAETSMTLEFTMPDSTPAPVEAKPE